MDNITIIGIGHKARQGKDVLATGLQASLKEKNKESFILHFADPLKEEVSSKTDIPLIFKRHANGKNYYFLRDNQNTYKMFTSEEMPNLHTMFEDRQINEYFHMKEKDPTLLQIWGTDFRRNIDKYYWINALKPAIINIAHSLNGNKGYIIIPDVRFINETEFIKDVNGVFIRIMRMNEDGTIFTDNARSAKHNSETELDGYKADYTVIANSGDLKKIRKEADIIINKLL